jgi:presenilin-like A22 family membrane protease
VLLSALVFPGLGHLYLKRWVAGGVLTCVAAFSVYYIFLIAMDIALDVSQQIETGAIPADIATVSDLVSLQLSGREQTEDLASIALLLCWIAGILGSYWQGRSQDKLDATTG